MGTRGIIGFAIDGEPKVTYNHFDSYPSGIGIEFLAACREFAAMDPIKVRDQIKAIRLVDEGAAITIEEAQELNLPATVVGQEWYHALRSTQGDIKANLAFGVMINSKDFPLDSLFCEWGYVLNITSDAAVLEVYRGFQNVRPDAGLWAGQPTVEYLQEEIDFLRKHDNDRYADIKQTELDTDSGYKAIQLLTSYDLANLPDDDTFIAETEKVVYGEEN